ncbi:DUF992 domain-containing protein [Ancylobacter sonchi]|uniref:DUF992 domain-containing protein n=1 Tax=Ancylobacter sonchi TaxID=1937790 RepID=UPI001BD69829|nr:DUF992 domain-containing protein [Ancylobacter sonchi]MBS7536358.1 DUF992 domain-containing protein [Ancylobacter sonchi]
MTKTLLALSLAAGLVASVPASAADRVDAGVLVCSVASSISMIVSSKQEMSCTFKPVNGPDANYKGVISRVGLDLGITGAGMMTWGVAALTKSVAPGALAGKYAGVSADVALGVGVGANALVGTDKSVALNPVSVEGNIGASLALGVAEMTLTYLP